MKIKYILIALVLLFGGFYSCQDELSVDLADRKFVRLNETSISLSAGEKLTVKASVDTLGSNSKQFVWSVVDPSVAVIEAVDNQTAIVTALKEGNTVIKVESSDNELKYFSDLSVSKERIIKILAIGNRSSEDAVENYLYDLAEAAGHKVIIGNLHIDGSSLELHWTNASENKDAYEFRKIGTDGGLNREGNKSIAYAVRNENWDYISFEQVSQLAGMIDTYQEFLPKLVEYVKPMATNPEIKYILHQPWAYSQNSNHEGFDNYDNDEVKMYKAIVDAVSKAKELSGIDIIIPTGTAIQNARTTYLDDSEYLGDLITRDGVNLSFERGRLTAASTWYDIIFGKNVEQNPFSLNSLSEYENKLIKAAAHSAVLTVDKVTPLTAYRYPEENIYVLNAPIYIDFGPIFSGAPFNNYGRPTDPKISDLKEENGASTHFAIEVKDRFTGVLERGLENDLGFPKTASEDMFFSDGNNADFKMSSFALSNFNPNSKYTFVFYGAINDNNTETEFRVIGKNEDVAYLINDHNRKNVAIVSGISPSNYGTIMIKLTKGPNNTHWAGFFGINTMIIIPEGYVLPGI